MLRRFLDQPVWVRVLRGIALAAVVTVAAVYTPTPYVLEAPGRAVPVSSIVHVDDARTTPINGQYLMTTVLSEKASVMLCIYGLLEPDATLTRSPSTDGLHAQGPGDVDQMELSQYLSTRVALQTLGLAVDGKYLGLRILGLAKESPNIGVLRPGDLLVEVAGKKRPTFTEFKALLANASQPLDAVVQRDSQTVAIKLVVTLIQGQKRIGALPSPEYEPRPLPVKVDFASSNTSGASGGLVFALEIYDLLSPEDLAKGRTIAATGTLDGSAHVGGIQGIAFKLIAAERAGAGVFLVPRENWEEIKDSATGLKLVPVDNFKEALDALR